MKALRPVVDQIDHALRKYTERPAYTVCAEAGGQGFGISWDDEATMHAMERAGDEILPMLKRGVEIVNSFPGLYLTEPADEFRTR